MFLHVFAFRWKVAATESDKQRAAEEILGLQEKIPELLETHVGINTSPRGEGYTFGGVMRFTSEEAFHVYEVHPAHQELLGWLGSLIEPFELDFAC